MVPLRKIAAILFALLLASCTYPAKNQTSTVGDLVSTAVAATLSANGLGTQETASPTLEMMLAYPLFYLSEASGSAQVWMLETDGVTTTQVTHEAVQVESYDVSKADGTVAYVTNNQLYLINEDGSNRRLFVDNAGAKREADDFYYGQRISDPRFSPDGKSLAYGMGGVWLLDLSNYEAHRIITTKLMDTEGGIYPEAIYNPLAWAPNSKQLLLSVLGQGGSTLAFFDPDNDPPIVEAKSTSIVCCQVSWLQDSRGVLVASPTIGLIEPGLWKFDAATGDQDELVAPVQDDIYQFVGWPIQLADASLRYFYTSSTDVPASDLPLFMMSSAADGAANRVQLRPDSFSNIGEVLWAEDGSLALVDQLNPATGSDYGSVVLATSDGEQLQVILNGAKELIWGP